MTEEKKEPSKQAKLYEFTPDETINTAIVIELAKAVRVGVGGHVWEKLSPELKQYFKEVA